jgi:hypothetical protein
LIMMISKSKAKPWIIFDMEEQEESEKREEANIPGEPVRKSKFF